jgi:hypothetical protein
MNEKPLHAFERLKAPAQPVDATLYRRGEKIESAERWVRDFVVVGSEKQRYEPAKCHADQQH